MSSQREILARLEPMLAEAGQPPLSSSALSRYATRMETDGSRIRDAREVAEVWVSKLGEQPARSF